LIDIVHTFCLCNSKVSHLLFPLLLLLLLQLNLYLIPAF
jgi:hypothetical protein